MFPFDQILSVTLTHTHTHTRTHTHARTHINTHTRIHTSLLTLIRAVSPLQEVEQSHCKQTWGSMDLLGCLSNGESTLQRPSRISSLSLSLCLLLSRSFHLLFLSFFFFFFSSFFFSFFFFSQPSPSCSLPADYWGSSVHRSQHS
jgi:hypothetical protein